MEEKEFREKVMPLQRLMYSLALKTGLPPDDAADAVQETQLRLWRGREGLPDTDSALKAYCLTAIRNEVFTLYRRRKPALPIDDAAGMTSTQSEDAAEAADTKVYLERIIETLPEGQQRVIRMSGFGGYEVAEISDATGFSPGNVRQLLSRARKKLREALR